MPSDKIINGKVYKYYSGYNSLRDAERSLEAFKDKGYDVKLVRLIQDGDFVNTIYMEEKDLKR